MIWPQRPFGAGQLYFFLWKCSPKLCMCSAHFRLWTLFCLLISRIFFCLRSSSTSMIGSYLRSNANFFSIYFFHEIRFDIFLGKYDFTPALWSSCNVSLENAFEPRYIHSSAVCGTFLRKANLIDRSLPKKWVLLICKTFEMIVNQASKLFVCSLLASKYDALFLVFFCHTWWLDLQKTTK